ncbi:SWIM zinc finger family protein [Cellulomonas chitinilytica]|nr:SWIM zinc finger family protein [Cellulomonas chitinilytica]
MTWTAEQVLALAPDAASVAAGRKLAAPGPWTQTGASDSPAAVWGLAAGSGKNPYVTVVDLAGPAFSCSCPSRKFPCKHALGLLLLWSAGAVPGASEPAEFAATWLESRAARAEKAASPARTTDPAAAAQRAERRADRVAGGVADLRRWLRDQVAAGLAGADRAGYRPYEQVAARLVDAQAPGLADVVRRLPSVAASGEGWAGRLLDELAMLHVLLEAHERVDDLTPELAAVVRRHVGYPTKAEDVLATPAVRDTWVVLAQSDSLEGRLAVRRVHLHGRATARNLAVVSFAPANQPLDTSLLVGSELDADVHTYPGDPLRALVGTRHADPVPATTPPAAVELGELARVWSAALEVDPWAFAVPVVTGPVTVGTDGGRWWLTDGAVTVPVAAGAQPWSLLVASGGDPVVLVADQTPTGLAPRAAWTSDGLVRL